MELDVDVARALSHLRDSDPELGRLIDRAGTFGLTLPEEPSTFAALAEAIVYQQLSPKAAATIFGRFCGLFPGAPSCPTPDQVLAASEEALRGAGLSGAKQRALHDLARRSVDGELPTLEEARGMDDEAIIEVKHGTIWKDTVECSPGQRSGAILPILLLQGDWPLLVDQPDDNVDPDFMCNVILPRIAALKGARQFIFVTHHANVPILSGAEQVALLGSDGKSALVQAEGKAAQMTPWIVSKLEGGQGAFETRRRAYESTGQGE